MTELEQGVFDLESHIPCDIPVNQIEKMLDIFSSGIEQGIASVILGFSVRYQRWVGVSKSKILSTLVSFDGMRLGFKPSEKDRINQLALDVARKMVLAINEAITGKRKWLKEIGHSPLGEDDKVFSLVISEHDGTFSLN